VRVLAVGGASWDTIAHVTELPDSRPQTLFASNSYETVGSTGAGKALNLARLGHEVHLHTLIGSDDVGQGVVDVLTRAGVTVHPAITEGPTERHVNLMANGGSRLSIYLTVATAPADLDVEPVVKLAADCDVVVLNILGYVRPLIPALGEIGKPFWTDLHDWDGTKAHHRDFADAAHVVVLSDDALDDPRPLCRALNADGARLVVCTRGQRGAVAFDADGDEHQVAAAQVGPAIDANGAGDAFVAGLIHGLVARGWDLDRALRAAALAGATAVTSQALASDRLDADLLETA
jgi:sugar/nucleoside kinase (ribokinase family)